VCRGHPLSESMPVRAAAAGPVAPCGGRSAPRAGRDSMRAAAPGSRGPYPVCTVWVRCVGPLLHCSGARVSRRVRVPAR
jgi:hypothetical protein